MYPSREEKQHKAKESKVLLVFVMKGDKIEGETASLRCIVLSEN